MELWTIGAFLLLAPLSSAVRTGPSPEFTHHHATDPRIFHGRTKREISHTQSPENDRHHLDDLTIQINLGNGEDTLLDLQLNRDLFPKNYVEKHHENGRQVIHQPAPHELELCHYQGTLRGFPRSWAAVSTCRGGLTGVVFDGQEMYHIEKGEKEHLVYRHSDLVKTNHSCGYDDTPFDSVHENNGFNRAERHRRDIASGKFDKGISNTPESHVVSDVVAGNDNKDKPVDIKGPWNANKRSRYVELLLVVDNKEYKDHGEDLQKVKRMCKDIANVMNALYSPLNIYIALVGVVVWTEYDEITLSTNGDTTLTNFLHYRRERLVQDHPNDNAQLLTGIQFDGGVVGKALKGPICTYEFSGGVNMWHSDVIGLVATTVAHELGHNFGMEHDTEDCECPDDRCIMAPASSAMKPTFWSSCSLEHLALAFEHGMDYCLRNKPTQLFESPICGNGFVEPGEECDCGLRHHCDNPCCNPDTCKLFSNATCATGECCDFTTCKLKRPGSVCRRSEHECDLPEYCTGESEFCPNDVFKVDGTSCKVGQAFCYQGTCRTHSDQCKLLWGPSGKKSDNQCYEQNRKGTRHGNCGYNRLTKNYVQCDDDDVRCGMLHCSHLNERLEFGMETVAILSHSFINSGGRIIPCRTALVDLGLNDVDPGLAPEGARCGEGRLCVNRKCMPVESLKVGPASCPQGCNGHGLCNSHGNCHCDSGYSPPYCNVPGPGGSIDSGPASNPDGSSLTALYVFLVLIPIICLVLLILYVRSKGSLRGAWLEKTKKSTPEKRSSRPGSRLGNLEISPPMPCSTDGTQSGSSSPTHALLPHVDTTMSGLSGGTVMTSTGSSDKLEGEETEVKYKRSTSLFGGFGFGRKKTETSSTKSTSFMQNLAKSISFPSPKFGTPSMKLPASGSGAPKYEIKVEHQEPRDDSTNALSPVAPPTTTENNETSVTTSVSAKSSSVADNYLKNISGEQKSFAVRPPRSAASSVLSKASSAAVKPTSPTKKIQQIILEPKKPPSPPTSPPPDYSSDPKLAFPHSSSFNNGAVAAAAAVKAAAAFPTTTASMPTSLSTGSLSNRPSKPDVPKKPIPNPQSYLNRNATVATTNVTSTFTSNVKPLQSPFFKKSTTSPSTTTSTTTTTTAATGPTTTFSTFKPPTSDSMPFHLTKTSTLPTNLSTAATSGPLPKSFTLPNATSGRPSISKPVLQAATPCASALISKAPSTGVSQSSILAGNKADKPRDRSSRGVVFCDPITLPSPTNPNNPPIIHQPNLPAARTEVTPTSISPISTSAPIVRATTATVITPMWSTEPKPLSTDAVICHIDETDSSDASKAAPIASPESDKVSVGISKLKSKLQPHKQPVASKEPSPPSDSTKENEGTKSPPPKPPRPERGKLRSLQISGPILQSEVNVKTNLLPVCRSEDIRPESSEPSRSSSPMPIRTAPPPPVSTGSTSPRPPLVASASLQSPPVTSTSASPRLPKQSSVDSVTSTASLPVTTGAIPKSRFNVPWRSKDKKSADRRDSAPPPEVQSPAKPPQLTRPGSGRAKRPASIATTKAVRPSAPPPKPPSAKPSPSRSTTSTTSTIVEEHDYDEPPKPKVEPIYERIRGDSAEKDVTSPLSPQSQEFVTPSSSPTLAKKSPDTLSTASSNEGDLMKEILKDLDRRGPSEENIYSSLMRNKDKKKKRQQT